MFHIYKQHGFQEIYRYFMDAYVSISQNGRVEIPRDIVLNEENPSVLKFLKYGVELLENALLPSIFSLTLETGFLSAFQTCQSEVEIAKLATIRQLVAALYEDNVEGILDTGNFWSDRTSLHAYLYLRPVLEDELQKIYFTPIPLSEQELKDREKEWAKCPETDRR